MNLEKTSTIITILASLFAGIILIGGAYATGLKYYADNTYVQQQSLERAMDRQDRKVLTREMYNLKDKRDLGGGLTPVEASRLERIKDELKPQEK